MSLKTHWKLKLGTLEDLPGYERELKNHHSTGFSVNNMVEWIHT